MSLFTAPPEQTPEQQAAELDRERIEAANMQHDADPGDPPTKQAFDQAVSNELC